MGDEDWEIADYFDPAFVTILPQRLPLPEEKKLRKLVRLDLRLQSRARARSWTPFGPGHSAMFILQRSIQRIVFKPVRLLLLERFKFRSKIRLICFTESFVRARQEICFELMRDTVVDSTNRPCFQIRLVQQPLVDQTCRTNQQCVTGKSGI